VPRKLPAWKQLVINNPDVGDLYGARQVSVAALDPNPDQPRKGPLRGVEDLASSIREYGLLHPVVVAPAVGGRFTLLAGHRRVAAYKWLFEHDARPGRWAMIPAIERDTPSAERLVVALIENLSREDLTEAEITAGLTVLRDLRGWTQAEISRRLGISENWLTQYFRVAGDADVSAHVQRGELRVGKAYDIVRAKDPDAKSAALAAALGGAPVAAVRRIAKGEFRNGTFQPDRRHGDGAGVTGGVAPEMANGRASAEFRNGTQGAGTTDATPASVATARIATATPDAAVRDLAELADALGVTVDLRDTELAKLIRASFEQDTPVVAVGALLRLMRADGRLLEGLIRSAQLAKRPK
jgi:ParB/RepB/Spo0J family partition protein